MLHLKINTNASTPSCHSRIAVPAPFSFHQLNKLRPGSITYTDDEGDICLVSSEEEFTEAVRIMGPRGVLKFTFAASSSASNTDHATRVSKDVSLHHSLMNEIKRVKASPRANHQALIALINMNFQGRARNELMREINEVKSVRRVSSDSRNVAASVNRHEALTELIEMGFRDRVRCLDALKATNNDVLAAVRILTTKRRKNPAPSRNLREQLLREIRTAPISRRLPVHNAQGRHEALASLMALGHSNVKRCIDALKASRNNVAIANTLLTSPGWTNK